MGQEIVYCSDCGRSLREKDFERGMAHRIENRPYCTGCREPAGEPEPTPAPASRLSESSRAVRRSGTSIRQVRVEKPRSRAPLIWGGAGGGLLLIIIVIAAASSGGGKRAVSPPAPPPAPVLPTEEARERDELRAREAKAEAALRKAREFKVTTAEDLDEKVVLYRQANFLARGTKFERPARRELESIELEGRRTVDKTFEDVKSRARSAAAKERFGEAAALLEEARKDPVLVDRGADLDEEIRSVEMTARRLFTTMRDEAMAARRKGDEGAVAGFRDRVVGWEMKKYLEEFDGWLATVEKMKPPPPPPTPAQKAWLDAVTAAKGRKYDAAIAAFERAARPESKGMIAAVRKVRSVVAAATQILAAWPAGKEITVRYVNSAGMEATAKGPVLRSGPTRIVVDSGGSAVFIELGEIAASTLAEVYGKEPSAQAGLCLFEGDVASARKHLASIAPPILAYGQQAAEVKPGSEESEARKRFHRAARAAIDPLRTGDVSAQVRELLEEFGDTAFVERNRSSIEALAGGSKEFLWAADDLEASGGFDRVDDERVKPCLRVSSDEGSSIVVSFSATAGAKLAAWAYVGGCCRETLAFAAEGTEVDKQLVSPSRLTLKRRHSQHGGEKRPSTWLWAKLPIPGWYATGGVKQLKLTSVQPGFGLGYVLLSGTRQKPPTGDALALEVKLHRAPVRFDPMGHPDLVAYWTFDEGEGQVAKDVSGHGHAARFAGNPRWVEGRKGGGIAFDGRSSHLRVANHPDLSPDAFTMAAWVKLPAPAGSVGNVFSKGENQGFRWRIIADGRVEVFDRGLRNMLMTTGRVPLEKWAHVAVTGDGTGMSVYIDGALAGKSSRPYSRPQLPHELMLGATPEFREWFLGTLDEMILFRRALTEEEIQALAGAVPKEAGGRKSAPASPAGGGGIATNLEVKSGRGYEWYSLAKGARIYVDRGFLVEAYPDYLEGATVLRTANDDKKSNGDGFLQFSLAREATVYVAHDPRIVPKPSWLSSFRKLGETFTISEGQADLYAKKFPAGRVSLGGNQTGDSNSCSMYVVVIK